MDRELLAVDGGDMGRITPEIRPADAEVALVPVDEDVHAAVGAVLVADDLEKPVTTGVTAPSGIISGQHRRPRAVWRASHIGSAVLIALAVAVLLATAPGSRFMPASTGAPHIRIAP